MSKLFARIIEKCNYLALKMSYRVYTYLTSERRMLKPKSCVVVG